MDLGESLRNELEAWIEENKVVQIIRSGMVEVDELKEFLLSRTLENEKSI